jgi:hypothetical protein
VQGAFGAEIIIRASRFPAAGGGRLWFLQSFSFDHTLNVERDIKQAITPASRSGDRFHVVVAHCAKRQPAFHLAYNNESDTSADSIRCIRNRPPWTCPATDFRSIKNQLWWNHTLRSGFAKPH